ncbi:hypothetical protein SAMN06269185_1858 [Natronoarchaeum philippinense]|uniref:Polyprenyl synthetase n=1 Tax=Natronoarchaeum philippinense TaxID=558529 RepID=A0A285NUR7_NATPI|nr:polyprenyl synthetase [Natronoarchaeum philippinense]SNZ12663.1 hypothetical protein SAMN06269185_1858 [Natronoarchaeum philippinense]
MTGQLTRDERSAELDRRVTTAVDADGTDCLDPGSLPSADDRWYGRLLALSYDAVAPTPDRTVTLTAGTAIELLREYWLVREQLIDTDDAAASRRELTTRLLASDYRYTSAYSTLGDLQTERLTECFEVFSAVSESLIETLGTPSPDHSDPDEVRFAERTAGALGRGAASIGAILADADERQRDRLETLGSGVATARAVRAAIDGDGATAATDGTDTRALRRYANRRLQAAQRALEELSESATTASLKGLLDDAPASEA